MALLFRCLLAYRLKKKANVPPKVTYMVVTPMPAHTHTLEVESEIINKTDVNHRNVYIRLH